MSYTREQRAANAAKAAAAEVSQAPEAVEQVTEQREPDRPKPRANPRNEIMDEIVRSRNPEPEQTPEPATVEPVVDASPEPPVEAPVVETIKVKVNGVESDVPKAEVEEYGGVRAYQIAKASEHHLREAKEVAAETKRTHAEITKVLQSLAPPAPAPVTDAEFLKSKVDVIRFGTAEESAAAFQEVLTRSHPVIDQNQVTSEVSATINFSAAEKQFAAEFGDILINPDLSELVRIKKMRLLQAYTVNGKPNWSQLANVDFSTNLRNIGNQVRSVMGPRPSQPPQDVVTSSPSGSEREARKASIVNLPSAAARATPPAEAKPETREDTLNLMRKARGQSPH